MKKTIALLVIGGMFVFVSMECAITKSNQTIINPKSELSKSFTTRSETEQKVSASASIAPISKNVKEEEIDNNLSD